MHTRHRNGAIGAGIERRAKRSKERIVLFAYAEVKANLIIKRRRASLSLLCFSMLRNTLTFLWLCVTLDRSRE